MRKTGNTPDSSPSCRHTPAEDGGPSGNLLDNMKEPLRIILARMAACALIVTVGDFLLSGKLSQNECAVSAMFIVSATTARIANQTTERKEK